MDFPSILTIIISVGILVIGFGTFISSNLNRRLDDQNKWLDTRFNDFAKSFKDYFDAKLDAKIKPIEIALSNHVTDTDKKIDALDKKVDGLDKKLDRIIQNQSK